MSIITRLGRLARWWRERCLSDLINKREGETMSIRAYLCSQDARPRALVDEYGDDVVMDAVVEYRKLSIGLDANNLGPDIFGDPDRIAELESDLEEAESAREAAETAEDSEARRADRAEKEMAALRASTAQAVRA